MTRRRRTRFLEPVNNRHPFQSEGAIRLTTARYYTPSGRSIQAKGIDPDILIEEELPDDLKAKLAADKTFGEASLRGHLKNPDDKTTEAGKDPEETPGSSAYVPKEPEKDTQLQYALVVPAGNGDRRQDGRQSRQRARDRDEGGAELS